MDFRIKKLEKFILSMTGMVLLFEFGKMTHP